MNVKECKIGLFVTFFDHDKQDWQKGRVSDTKTGPPRAIVKLSSSKKKEVLIRNLRHSPPCSLMRITFDRKLLRTMIMGAGEVSILLDASATYDDGCMKPLMLEVMEGGQNLVVDRNFVHVEVPLGIMRLAAPVGLFAKPVDGS